MLQSEVKHYSNKHADNKTQKTCADSSKATTHKHELDEPAKPYVWNRPSDDLHFQPNPLITST
jgi:hypothetical protein